MIRIILAVLTALMLSQAGCGGSGSSGLETPAGQDELAIQADAKPVALAEPVTVAAPAVRAR